MTDVIENAELAEAQAAQPEQAQAEKPAKTEKAVKQPVPCACRSFEVVDESGNEPSAFTTECESTTLRTFAQGHDARLVSFLVQGEFDGLKVYRTIDGVRYLYEGAAHAAGSVSQPLANKADAALVRLNDAKKVRDEREAKRTEAREAKAAEKAQAKAAREAEKASKAAEKAAAKPQTTGPREVGATVVPGSQEGQAVSNGQVTIKIGRHEYVGSLSEDGKTVSYLNAQGEEQTRETESVRILTRG